VNVHTVRNLVVVSLAMIAAPLSAQSGGGRWAEAKCDLKPGHFLVNSGLLYLKSASNAKFDDQRLKDLKDAQRVLNQALTTGGQEKNPAAWYYLGRYYILVSDAPGVDSAFTRAEALKPACKDDIAGWRRVLWVPAFNAGVAAWQANSNDSAIAAFKRASSLLPDEPTSTKYLATLYFNGGRTDSAVVYFRRCADIAKKDPKFAQDYKDALYNLARIEQSQEHWVQAGVAYQEFLTAYPNDPEVLAAMGTVYMQTGKKDSAFATYRQVVAKGDSMGYYTLYRVGAAIGQSVPEEPDTAAAGGSCRTTARSARPPLTAARIRARCDSVTKGMANEYFANAQEAYTLSAQALDASLRLNPYYRETLIHRANTALGMRDSLTALNTARRLIAVDPMNKQSIKMMAYAQQANGKVDSVLHYLRLHDSTLVADVTINLFDSTDTGRDLKGLVTNSRPVASPPLVFVFEFLNNKGDVVTTQTVQVPAIQPAQSTPIEAQATGAGIVAWRYRKQ
jgi:tetratricopeptide (TPR) repeat protein